MSVVSEDIFYHHGRIGVDASFLSCTTVSPVNPSSQGAWPPDAAAPLPYLHIKASQSSCQRMIPFLGAAEIVIIIGAFNLIMTGLVWCVPLKQ